VGRLKLHISATALLLPPPERAEPAERRGLVRRGRGLVSNPPAGAESRAALCRKRASEALSRKSERGSARASQPAHVGAYVGSWNDQVSCFVFFERVLLRKLLVVCCGSNCCAPLALLPTPLSACARRRLGIVAPAACALRASGAQQLEPQPTQSAVGTATHT
jgi:hypothetical protein